MTLTELFDVAIERKASDIHLASGDAPRLRIAHDLVTLGDQRLDRADLATLIDPMMTPEAKLRLESGYSVERTIVHRDLGFVGIAYRFQDSGLAVTFRILFNQIPSLETVAGDALDVFNEVLAARHGLILIVGPTGSGKWTTACAIVEAINTTRAERIFVVVDHPSYMMSSKKSMLTELHVGVDCDSYERGLEIAHQSDLDVVALNDLPTVEALRQALLVADTGHVVIANLHANGCADAFERILATAGSQADALRQALARNLVVATAQQLLPKKEGPGRVPAYEYLRNTPDVARALMDGKLDRVREILENHASCRTMADAVRRLSFA